MKDKLILGGLCTATIIGLIINIKSRQDLYYYKGYDAALDEFGPEIERQGKEIENLKNN